MMNSVQNKPAFGVIPGVTVLIRGSGLTSKEFYNQTNQIYKNSYKGKEPFVDSIHMDKARVAFITQKAMPIINKIEDNLKSCGRSVEEFLPDILNKEAGQKIHISA